MTPPLSWHFLQDKNGRSQVVKSGKESDNGHVTSVQCCAKGDKTVLRVSFNTGSLLIYYSFNLLLKRASVKGAVARKRKLRQRARVGI